MRYKAELWDRYAEAQLLAIEGERLITRAIADGVRALRRRVMRRLDVGHRRRLPPIQAQPTSGLEPHR